MTLEGKPEDLTGMEVSKAREYIAHYITTLKLTEKKYQAVGEALATWNSRILLARSKGLDDLALEAAKEAERLKAQQERLGAEIGELKIQIETMQQQLPGLAARERTIDPDLLEQDLLMAAGYLPGEDEKAEGNRRFKAMEQDLSADADLAALKAKMGLNNPDHTTS
jgi:phage shock protein A